MSRRIVALALSAVALLGLSACAPSSPDSLSPTSSASSSPTAPAEESDGDGQSTAEACALIQDTIDEASAEFESAGTEDPAAVVDAMRNAAQKLSDASSQITNEEVAALVPPLQSMFEQLGDVMAAIIEGDASKVGELTELGTTFQETSEAFQELCAP